MKRLIGWATRLYPARWRARYGAEFAALIEDVRPSWRDLWDVVRGAAKMRMEATPVWKGALVFAAVAALLGATIGPVFESKRYVAPGETRIAIEFPRGYGETSEQFVNASIVREMVERSLAWDRMKEVVEEENLFVETRARHGRLGLEEGQARLRAGVQLPPEVERTGEGAYVLTLRMNFRYPDADGAKRAATALLSHASAETAERAAGMYPFLKVVRLGDVVKRAERVAPNRPLLAALWAFFGTGFWFLLRYPKATLLTAAGGLAGRELMWYVPQPGLWTIFEGMVVGLVLGWLSMAPWRRRVAE